MYCVISWDISAENPRWRLINDQLLNCLAGYQYVRPVYTFYLVTINSAADVTAIRICFDAVKQRTREPIGYILSPPFSGHTWTGTIADWASVNAVTQA